jgi:hypothetical protein
VPREIGEDRVIRKDEVFRNVAVGSDDPIDTDRFERPLRTGSSGDPANEHDVAIGRVLDRLSAEIGNEVERSMIRLAYSCGPRTGRVVCG